MIKNVDIYKDFSLKKKYSTTLGQYDLEVIGEKARVHQNGACTPNKSRLNKLNHIGETSKGHMYSMIVEGVEVFIILEKELNLNKE